MDYAFIVRSLPILLDGVEITAELTAVALLGSALGGLVVAAGRRSRLGPMRLLAAAYVEVMRGTPIMVQVFIMYFGLPSIGVYPEAFTSAAIALVLQNSAYTGEIYRAGIESVHRTQAEAALSLGMRARMAMIWIVLPQAIRRVLPPLGSQAIVILKDTSIASTIAVTELTHAGKLLLDRSAAPYETFLLIAALYLVLSGLVLGMIRLVAARFPVRT